MDVNLQITAASVKLQKIFKYDSYPESDPIKNYSEEYWNKL